MIKTREKDDWIEYRNVCKVANSALSKAKLEKKYEFYVEIRNKKRRKISVQAH